MNTQTQSNSDAVMRAALKMAIEVMQRYLKETPLGNQPHMIAHKAEETIQACKEALAQPAQEPVAVCKDSIVNWVNGKAIDGWLYTRPAPSCSCKDKK